MSSGPRDTRIPGEEIPRPSRAAVQSLARALRDELGSEKVLDDPDLFGPYSEDYSFSGAHPPDLVVRAGSARDVQVVFAKATEHRVWVTPRGLGSGKSGGALPIHGGVVLSMERMNRLKEISRENMWAIAEPGIVTQDLMRAVEEEKLFYPPDPNSLDICSLGGNVACNAGGPRALKYGVTRNYVLGLEVVLPTGEIMRLGRKTLKGVAGYDLTSLIVGSEGTLGVITEITTRLIPLPLAVQTALVSFASPSEATRAITEIFAAGVVPRTLELLDSSALDALRSKGKGRFSDQTNALLILETDASSENQAMEELARAAGVCTAEGAIEVLVAQDEAQRSRMWEPRRTLSMTLAECAPCKISEDVVVPRSLIPEMLDRVRRIGDRLDLRLATYGHAGDGNLHVNVLFEKDARPKAELAAMELMKAVTELGGTISGEHGVGLTKREFLGFEQSGPLIELQKRIKRVFDPAGILNPGKIFPSKGSHE